MDGVRFESKAHKNRFYVQHFLKNRNYSNASATANRQGLDSKYFCIGFFSCFVGVGVDRTNITFRSMQGGDLYVDLFWSNSSKMFGYQSCYLFVLLVWNQSC